MPGQSEPVAENFNLSPWQMGVSGLVHNPKTYGLEDLLRFEQEERINRLRCMEGLSLEVSWLGFPLAMLQNEVELLASAPYVRFEMVSTPKKMSSQKSKFYPWLYNEGLWGGEALHDLTILEAGLYGRPMPNQNGAPIRLVVP